MGDDTPPPSVVINTIDRADSLSELLDALTLQWFDDPFEVIVVTGPSTDHTAEVVEAWQGRIKHLECPVANLSASRNIGIGAAAGDVVVFIDDDAIPEPRWLAELLGPFATDPEIIATGGYVIDHMGFDLQCRFNRCDRLGRAGFDSAHPFNSLCFPGASEFPYVPGGNAAWRRDPLIAIGAFDENYEYYLDEVDVAARAVDAGWRLHQVAGAAIHHKFLPSSLRGRAKVLTRRYPVLKNKALFGLFNGRDHHTIEEIVGEAAYFARHHRADVRAQIDAARLGPDALDVFDEESERALADALEVGLAGRRLLGGARLVDSEPDDLLEFPVRQPAGPRRRYVFISQAIPPDPIGGIGRYMMDLASGLGAQGHELRVITDGRDHDTIDLESGVWVHRLVKPATVSDAAAVLGAEVPARIWANAVRIDEEVTRLGEDHPVDLVYCAVWDTEAIAVQQRSTVPVVVALVTSLALALESKPSWAQDPTFLEEFAAPMLAVERAFIVNADAVHAISSTILEEVQRSSSLTIEPAKVTVAALGSPDPRLRAADLPASGAGDVPAEVEPSDPDDEVPDRAVRLLFVGRFEKRKGIDLLLEALSIVMPDEPRLEATLVGKSDLPAPEGANWVEWMDRTLAPGEWRERLLMLGETPDDVLHREYARSDIFVAPSRFESFGLIYVEAMAHGLPVVALESGAATEVVAPDCGLLVKPDALGLADAITSLMDDPGLRRAMGLAGRERFEANYTQGAMVERVGLMLAGLAAQPCDDEPRP